jgi:hypothetical protein
MRIPLRVGLLVAALLVATQTVASAQTTRRSRDADIARDELNAVTAVSLYEAVQSLRPTWLRGGQTQTVRSGSTGSNSLGANRSASSADGQRTDGIIVYVGMNRMGGIEALRELSIDDVDRVERLRAPAAQTRFGTGHLNGAIVVHLRAN